MNKKAYKEAVNKIVISDELRAKIIQNSSEKNTYKYKRNNLYKHFQRAAGIAACFAFCVLSYYAVTNYYPFSVDVSAPPSAQAPNYTTNHPNAENHNTEPVVSDIDNVQNHINASDAQNAADNTRPDITANSSKHQAVNNFLNADNASAPNTNPIIQSSPSDTEPAEENDFPPVLSAAPSPDKNTDGEYAANLGENMSAIAEMEQELGYDIQVPHYVPDGYKTDSFSVPFGAFAQITYTNETDTLYYRTAKDSEDISGDYNHYRDIETVTINNNEVTIKGNEHLYHNASWFSGDTAFSIYSGKGVEKDIMIDIVKSVD